MRPRLTASQHAPLTNELSILARTYDKPRVLITLLCSARLGIVLLTTQTALSRGVIETHEALCRRAAIVHRTQAAPASIDNAVAESMQVSMTTMRETSLGKISLRWTSGRGCGDQEFGLHERNEGKQEERG